MEDGFYENFILKTVIQKSEQKRNSKFKIKKKTERDMCVSDEVRTWGFERVKPMMYLCVNLAVD